MEGQLVDFGSMQGANEAEHFGMQAQLASGASDGTASPQRELPTMNIQVPMYPPAMYTHEDVVQNLQHFSISLHKLLNHLQQPYKVPKIGGQEIDVHRLYCEVTKLGGLEVVMARKLFVTVCEPFNFPASFTNKSFVMRKLYCNLLHHYEQVYYHRNEGPILAAPVNEHAQTQRNQRASSPAKRIPLSRAKSTPTKNGPGTPRGGTLGFKAAISNMAGSPMNSPSGKRKQSDSTNAVYSPTGHRMHQSKAQQGFNPTFNGIGSPFNSNLFPGNNNNSNNNPSNFNKNMMGNTMKTMSVHPSYYTNEPRNAGRMSLATTCELPVPAPCHTTSGMMPHASPTTSCTSGTQHIPATALAPPGMQKGTEFNTRITAVYENCYQISMLVPNAAPVTGHLMMSLQPGMTLMPGVIPHQQIMMDPQPRMGMGKKGSMYRGMGPLFPGGNGPPLPHGMHNNSNSVMGTMPGMVPAHMSDMSSAGGPMMGGGGGMHAGSGGGAGAGRNRSVAGARVDPVDEPEDLESLIPEELLSFENLTRDNFWDQAGVFDMGPLGGPGTGDADATAAVVAQYSPSGHQEAAKKLRLRSNGGYAVMDERSWAPTTSSGLVNATLSLDTMAGGKKDAGKGAAAVGAGAGGGGGEEGVMAPARSAFTCFVMELSLDAKVLAGRPVHEVAADMWENMNADQKQPWQAMARTDHERYTREVLQKRLPTNSWGMDQNAARNEAEDGAAGAPGHDGTATSEATHDMGGRRPATSTDVAAAPPNGLTRSRSAGPTTGGGAAATCSEGNGKVAPGGNNHTSAAAGSDSHLPASTHHNNNNGLPQMMSAFDPHQMSSMLEVAGTMYGGGGVGGEGSSGMMGGGGRVSGGLSAAHSMPHSMPPQAMRLHADHHNGMMLGGSNSMPPGSLMGGGGSMMMPQGGNSVTTFMPMYNQGMPKQSKKAMAQQQQRSMDMINGVQGAYGIPGLLGHAGDKVGVPSNFMLAGDAAHHGMGHYDLGHHYPVVDDGQQANHQRWQYKQYKQQQREQQYGALGGVNGMQLLNMPLNAVTTAWNLGYGQQHPGQHILPSNLGGGGKPASLLGAGRGAGGAVHNQDQDQDGEEDTMLHMVPNHAADGELFNGHMDISGGGAAPGAGGAGGGGGAVGGSTAAVAAAFAASTGGSGAARFNHHHHQLAEEAEAEEMMGCAADLLLDNLEGDDYQMLPDHSHNHHLQHDALAGASGGGAAAGAVHGGHRTDGHASSAGADGAFATAPQASAAAAIGAHPEQGGARNSVTGNVNLQAPAMMWGGAVKDGDGGVAGGMGKGGMERVESLKGLGSEQYSLGLTMLVVADNVLGCTDTPRPSVDGQLS